MMNDPERLEKWVNKALAKYDANHDGKLDIEET
jgi:Ca2+-binding EF-hand superfamily protein